MATREQLATSVAKIGLFETVQSGMIDGALGTAITPEDASKPVGTPVSATAQGNANAINYLWESLVAAGCLNSVAP